MATNRTMDETYDARLNDLYWNSDMTIDEIIDELSVGRHTLYASIRPLPSGMRCSTCGDVIVFSNRTTRASGAGTCAGCGMEAIVPDDLSRNGGPAANGDRVSRASEAWERWRDDLVSVAPERAALIGGAAVLGVLVGSAAVRVLRS